MYNPELRGLFVTAAVKAMLTVTVVSTPIVSGTRAGLCSHWAQYHMQVLTTLPGPGST